MFGKSLDIRRPGSGRCPSPRLILDWNVAMYTSLGLRGLVQGMSCMGTATWHRLCYNVHFCSTSHMAHISFFVGQLG